MSVSYCSAFLSSLIKRSQRLTSSLQAQAVIPSKDYVLVKESRPSPKQIPPDT